MNPEQEIAVKHTEGPLLIFAGAGSGKTRVISNRINHMIRNEGIAASKIVALSFTNKSAREMRERIRSMVPRGELKGIVISTFHSFGLQILKKHIHEIGYSNPFSLNGTSDTESIVTNLLKENKYNPKEIPARDIIAKISRMKTSGPEYQDYLSHSENVNDQAAVAVFLNYNKRLQELNALDFDDLILLPTRLFRENEDIRYSYEKKYRYYMVDEFQDTNQTQYEFLTTIMGANKNLCVVGDDDQSIYGFRGSNVNLILDFEKDFADTKVVRLLQNYRSTRNIIAAANALIGNNKGRVDKNLFSTRPELYRIRYVERMDERDEASFVADEIFNDQLREKRKYGEMAILFRTNYQSRPFEEELRLRSIPYKVAGGYNYFDRKEVKDVISYLRFIANPADDLALIRIINYPGRGVGEQTISRLLNQSIHDEVKMHETLQKLCETPDFLDIKRKTTAAIYEFLEFIEKYRKKFFHSIRLSPVLKEMVDELGFEALFLEESENEKVAKARFYNLSEMVNMLSFFESDWEEAQKPTLFDFLNRISMLMVDDEGNDDKEQSRVQLMTIHQSKGLEFESVYLTGMEEGILPNARVIESEDVDEERRLTYVAVTRAKEKLCLTSAAKRHKFGEIIDSEPSRFLAEIPDSFLDRFPAVQEEDNDFLSQLESLKE